MIFPTKIFIGGAALWRDLGRDRADFSSSFIIRGVHASKKVVVVNRECKKLQLLVSKILDLQVATLSKVNIDMLTAHAVNIDMCC